MIFNKQINKTFHLAVMFNHWHTLLGHTSEILTFAVDCRHCDREILESSWNLIGPPGNFCVRCRRSTALVSSHKNMDKYLSQKYEIYRHQMCFFKFQMHQNPFSAGALCCDPCGGAYKLTLPRFLFGWGGDTESWNTHLMGISALRRRPKQGKHVLDFS